MNALERTAHAQHRRDEVPNQELARDLAATKDRDGICEIAENLGNRNKSIQADCIKVLYEIGTIDPSLIAEYAEEFVKLLHSRNNRMVWGGMIALGTVAGLKPHVVLAHLDEIERAIETGSVITVDNGVEVLARAASRDEKNAREILPYVLEHLRTCRAQSIPPHAEKTLIAINAGNKARFINILNRRMNELTGAARARVQKVVKAAEER
ncbi:MAG TPA: hypothetical protein VF784_16250 [Anaerolineales bacterium]